MKRIERKEKRRQEGTRERIVEIPATLFSCFSLLLLSSREEKKRRANVPELTTQMPNIDHIDSLHGIRFRDLHLSFSPREGSIGPELPGYEGPTGSPDVCPARLGMTSTEYSVLQAQVAMRRMSRPSQPWRCACKCLRTIEP